MAILNGMYIFVSEEQIVNSVQVPEHPVEKGLDITDYVHPNSIQLSLTGEIVGEGVNDIIDSIKKAQQQGDFVVYCGVSIMENAIISDFNIVHTNEISGGCSFTMTIREIRIAGSSYDASTSIAIGSTKSAGRQQVQSGEKQVRYHTVKSGESRWSISELYKSHGCTIAYLTTNNNNTSCLKQIGNWYTLKIGAKMMIGEW